MASGDSLIEIGAGEGRLPSSSYAVPNLRNRHLVVEFSDSADEEVYFGRFLPRSYASGGLTVRLLLAMNSTSTNNVKFDVAFEKVGTGDDIDVDSFASAKTGLVAVPTTIGEPFAIEVSFLDGAEMDNVGTGDFFRLKVRRLGTDPQDDAIGHAHLLGIEIRET